MDHRMNFTMLSMDDMEARFAEQKRRADLYLELAQVLEQIHDLTSEEEGVVCAIVHRKSRAILAKCKGE